MFVGSFACSSCGEIKLSVPKAESDSHVVSCSSCGRLLGTWGEIREEFLRSISEGGGADLHDGMISSLPGK